MEITKNEIFELRKFVDDLNFENALIVVEGKKDRQALRNIGIKKEIIQFYSFQGMNNFADHISNYQKVILLFDGDRKGKYLSAKTMEKVQRRTKVDLTFKKKLVNITKGKIRCIEQLASYEQIIC